MAEVKQVEYNNNKNKSGRVMYGSSKKKGNGFTGKCASLVKQQRARIYILGRCATMLLCWYIQEED